MGNVKTLMKSSLKLLSLVKSSCHNNIIEKFSDALIYKAIY